MSIEPMYALAGAMVGLLVGVTGVGGGSLMTPLLVVAFGFHPATAVGTDLLFASATKTVGTSVHGWRGTVEWRVVRRLAMGSIPAALLMLIVLGVLGKRSEATATVISAVLGMMLIVTALATLLRRHLLAWLTPRLGTLEGRALLVATVMLGAALGGLVALTSVGAGALGITALLVLYPELPIARLVGSDIAHAVPLTLVAGAGHLMLGSIDLDLLLSLLLGSVPAVIIGSLISSRINERALGIVLAGVLAIVGVKMLF